MEKYTDALEFRAKFEAVIRASHDLIDATLALEKLAADVQEVRHGRWIEEYNVKRFANQVYCSECKKNASFIFISNEHYGISAHGEYKKAPYCPNCGAKMDEEVG